MTFSIKGFFPIILQIYKSKSKFGGGGSCKFRMKFEGENSEGETYLVMF